MADRPILLFPLPETANRTKGPRFRPSIHRPSHLRQGERLSPIFQRLQQAFESRRIELQQTAAGFDPEQVLVIEIIESVENFANAIRRIEGLEWLGELEIDEIAPDEDFYDKKNADKKLSGRLYLVMANARALAEMLSLWKRYQANPDLKFKRGLTKFRDIFLRLTDLRRWGVQDRIEETGLFEVWRETLKKSPEENVPLEVELWFRESEIRRREVRDRIKYLIEDLGGTIQAECVISEISYHGILGDIPAEAAGSIISQREVELFKSDSVMFFRPVGQMVAGEPTTDDQEPESIVVEKDLPSGQPSVAILDGHPLSNHSLLKERIIIDDPDDYGSSYSFADQRHGSGMASLIIHGDLNDTSEPLSRPVYLRPIMKPIDWFDSPRPEQIPANVLPVDLLHRSVRRIFERDGRQDAVAPSVRIINISIGDSARQFNQLLSPLARLIDWMSFKYQVLFIISAGNHAKAIETGITKGDFSQLSQTEKTAEIVKSIYRDARHRKLLSPSESINGISVGALHFDNASIQSVSTVTDLLPDTLPSPYSAFGSGYRRAIKPDILVKGGRQLYSDNIMAETATFEPRTFSSPPGNLVASPSRVSAELDKVVYTCGTSNAAALASRAAAQCYENLISILNDEAKDMNYEPYMAALLKTMIVHGSTWGEVGASLEEILDRPEDSRQLKNWISRWIGYGVPSIDRVMACTDQRATLIGFGHLADSEAHLYRLPLPPSLTARRDMRRITVTLAWLLPIAATTQRYRMANLWFEISGGNFASRRIDADWNAARRGTVQHEVFQGDRAIPILEGMSLPIKINCRKDASKIVSPIRYGLAVTLEVAEEVQIPIYQEVRDRVLSAIRIQPENI